jgi:cytoskeletal protein CcmA (bactofilin family)
MRQQAKQMQTWLKWLGSVRFGGALVAGAALLILAVPALAAEVRGGEGEEDIFRLPAGEVVNDDLYVGAREIYIDGVVEGDLVAAGGYIEINGEVTEDVILAGGGIVINGRVGDDARIAGGSVTITGAVADDLFVAGGGPFWPGTPAVPFRIGARAIVPGIQLASSATVGGDTYIVGGRGALDGVYDGDLFAGMGSILLSGRVAGDARLYGQQIEVQDDARVAGTLRYGSGQPATIPPGVAATVVQEEAPQTAQPAPQRTVARQILGWLWRTILLVIGFALLAWLVWQLAPGVLHTANGGIRARPLEAALYGIVVTALLMPVIFAFVLLAAIFWGIPGALAAASFLLGAVGLLWILSPLVTGFWLGGYLRARGYITGELAGLWVGALAIVILARVFLLIPCVGPLAAGLLYLASFVLAVGGLILARRRADRATVMVFSPAS